MGPPSSCRGWPGVGDHGASASSGSTRTTSGATAATSGWASSTSRARRTNVGCSTASQLSGTTTAPRVAAMPTSMPCANPRLAPFSMMRRSGKASRRAATEPSEEPLSTTTDLDARHVLGAGGGDAAHHEVAAVEVEHHDACCRGLHTASALAVLGSRLRGPARTLGPGEPEEGAVADVAVGGTCG